MGFQKLSKKKTNKPKKRKLAVKGYKTVTVKFLVILRANICTFTHVTVIKQH